jgi:hypothetical protein
MMARAAKYQKQDDFCNASPGAGSNLSLSVSHVSNRVTKGVRFRIKQVC